MAVAERKIEVGGGFHYHLYRGSDLLAEEKTSEALEAIEEALALQPGSQEAMGLQAATLFKLGRYDDAINAYRLLLRANPKEQALYVNLALVLLKAGRLDDAEAELRQAMTVGGESKRLHGYLGMVYAKKREYEKALIAFNKASAAKMVAEMEDLIRKRQEGAERPEAPSEGESEIQRDLDEAVERSQAAVIGAAQRRRKLLLTPDAAAVPEEALPAPAAPPAGASPGEPRRVLPAAPAAPLAALSAGLLRIDLAAGAVCALSDLSYCAEAPKAEPLFKRFKGRTTKSHFGPPEAPFCKVSGQGAALLQARPGRRLYLFEMAGKDTAFVTERALYAFSSGLAWENGRIGLTEESSVDLVTLSGTGQFAVVVGGEVSVIETSEDGEGVLVALPALVGWQGRMAPRPVAAPGGLPAGAGPYLRLKGTGRVILGPLV